MNSTRVVATAALSLVFLASCGSRQAVPETTAAASNPAAAHSNKEEVALSLEQQRAIAIETQAAQLSEEPDLLRVKGSIALADDRAWRIGVRTVGSVIAVYKNLGDYVQKGQILARYHADEVRDSRALYRRAISDVTRAKAVQTQALRNRDRARRMLELKAGALQQVEQTEQDVVTAQAEVRSAEIEVDRLRDLLEDDLRVPAEPKPGQDEIEDDVPIIAPANGYILEKNVTPGKSVEISSVTFVIGDLSRVWMLASVPQEDLAKLRLGQNAAVVLPGDPARRASGKITNLGQTFNPVTRVMEVRIELDNPDSRFHPEMLANAEIPVGGHKPTILVPSDAVQQVGDQEVVFVQTGPGRFEVRAVRLGEAADGKTPILEGIKAGEPVAVRGSFILKSQLLKSTLESE
jgi:cobalt-zinc-cadmium efflux system membrane fusion protein